MSVEDRDYARVDRGPQTSFSSRGGGGGLFRGAFGAQRGQWPMHVMLIAFCCAVYLADTLLPQRRVQASQWVIAPGKEQAVQDMIDARAPMTSRFSDAGPNGIGFFEVVPGVLPNAAAAHRQAQPGISRTTTES